MEASSVDNPASSTTIITASPQPATIKPAAVGVEEVFSSSPKLLNIAETPENTIAVLEPAISQNPNKSIASKKEWIAARADAIAKALPQPKVASLLSSVKTGEQIIQTAHESKLKAQQIAAQAAAVAISKQLPSTTTSSSSHSNHNFAQSKHVINKGYYEPHYIKLVEHLTSDLNILRDKMQEWNTMGPLKDKFPDATKSTVAFILLVILDLDDSYANAINGMGRDFANKIREHFPIEHYKFKNNKKPLRALEPKPTTTVATGTTKDAAKDGPTPDKKAKPVPPPIPDVKDLTALLSQPSAQQELTILRRKYQKLEALIKTKEEKEKEQEKKLAELEKKHKKEGILALWKLTGETPVIAIPKPPEPKKEPKKPKVDKDKEKEKEENEGQGDGKDKEVSVNVVPQSPDLLSIASSSNIANEPNLAVVPTSSSSALVTTMITSPQPPKTPSTITTAAPTDTTGDITAVTATASVSNKSSSKKRKHEGEGDSNDLVVVQDENDSNEINYENPLLRSFERYRQIAIPTCKERNKKFRQQVGLEMLDAVTKLIGKHAMSLDVTSTAVKDVNRIKDFTLGVRDCVTALYHTVNAEAIIEAEREKRLVLQKEKEAAAAAAIAALAAVDDDDLSADLVLLAGSGMSSAVAKAVSTINANNHTSSSGQIGGMNDGENKKKSRKSNDGITNPPSGVMFGSPPLQNHYQQHSSFNPLLYQHGGGVYPTTGTMPMEQFWNAFPFDR